MRPTSLHPCCVLIAALILPVVACAKDEAPALEDLPEAPPPPEAVQSGEPLEPEITIIQKEDATVEEYRIAGRLYMVKVTPVVGPPYYLTDQDGDGRLESRIDGLTDPVVPQWVIFSW